MDIKEAYRILDVSETDNQSDIIRKYRHLIMKYHPDKSKLSKEKAHEMIIKIIQAWKIVRENYDGTKEKEYSFEILTNDDELFNDERYLSKLRKRYQELRSLENDFYQNTYNIEKAVLLLYTYVKHKYIDKAIEVWDRYVFKYGLPFIDDILNPKEVAVTYEYLSESYLALSNYSRAMDILIYLYNHCKMQLKLNPTAIAIKGKLKYSMTRFIRFYEDYYTIKSGRLPEAKHKKYFIIFLEELLQKKNKANMISVGYMKSLGKTLYGENNFEKAKYYLELYLEYPSSSGAGLKREMLERLGILNKSKFHLKREKDKKKTKKVGSSQIAFSRKNISSNTNHTISYNNTDENSTNEAKEDRLLSLKIKENEKSIKMHKELIDKSLTYVDESQNIVKLFRIYQQILDNYFFNVVRFWKKYFNEMKPYLIRLLDITTNVREFLCYSLLICYWLKRMQDFGCVKKICHETLKYRPLRKNSAPLELKISINYSTLDIESNIEYQPDWNWVDSRHFSDRLTEAIKEISEEPKFKLCIEKEFTDFMIFKLDNLISLRMGKEQQKPKLISDD